MDGVMSQRQYLRDLKWQRGLVVVIVTDRVRRRRERNAAAMRRVHEAAISSGTHLHETPQRPPHPVTAGPC